jgi:redox-sensitive bicupin YhaK (pirin superfamily)
LDYNSKIDFSPSENPRGVNVHPHRGFETVTIAYKGKIEHYDSTGNSGVISEGGIQWMTAGSGILHKEFHEKEFSKAGGEFHMVQIWVNLPSKYKMTAPKYQAIENNQLDKYQLPDSKGVVEVIAGEYEGIKGSATTFTPIEMYSCRVLKGAALDLSLPADFNTGILILEGSIKINDNHIALTDNFCLFKNDGTGIKIETLEDAIFLVLSGEPINEPIVSHGPFLMNTAEEIQQAMRDFGSGKFGHLK